MPRVEDGCLLTGRDNFIDDHPSVANLCHGAIVRSSHAHARILGDDLTAALAMAGLLGVITGADVATTSKPYIRFNTDALQAAQKTRRLPALVLYLFLSEWFVQGMAVGAITG